MGYTVESNRNNRCARDMDTRVDFERYACSFAAFIGGAVVIDLIVGGTKQTKTTQKFSSSSS
jgi:hypothetical protein